MNRFLGREGDILALMVRSSENSGTNKDAFRAAQPSPRPGISDIDLTVIVRVHSIPERLLFLERFWRRYAQLRWVAPMLVEVDILTLEEFADSLRLACAPMQSRKTFQIILNRLSPNEQRALQDAMTTKDRQANIRDHRRNLIMGYHYFVLPHLFQTEQPIGISTALLEHSLEKMADQLELSGGRAQFSDFDAMRKFHELLPLLRDYLSGDTSVDAVPTKNRVPDLGELEKLSILFCRSPADNGSFSLGFLVPDNASEEQLHKAISSIRRFCFAFSPVLADRFGCDPNLFGQEKGWPLLLPISLWPIWCRTYPLEAAALKQGGCVILGDEPVACPEPETSDFLQSASIQYGIWLINRNDWFKEKEPRRTVLFEAMSGHIQRYRHALTEPQPMPSAGRSAERNASFEDVYRTSGLQLDRLRDTITASRSH
ncbi:MAG: hypothetical protein P8N76_22050 [Pirellulaceae bacterium]|nr:hypothetical protein [Pirellulaceae bacterium]